VPGRLFAIGDIHGCVAALDAILKAVAPQPEDTVVLLGDYVDRGPDTCGVLEMLIALARRTRLVPLLGNHDEMLLLIAAGRIELLDDWLAFGGDATLASYDAIKPSGVWPQHIEFLKSCRLVFETDRHFFVHGNYQADVPFDRQSREVVLWESLKRRDPGPHVSGKTAIVGHTSQKTGEVLNLGYLMCIDTCCYGNGWLTAMEVTTGQLWQANKKGALRNCPKSFGSQA